MVASVLMLGWCCVVVGGVGVGGVGVGVVVIDGGGGGSGGVGGGGDILHTSGFQGVVELKSSGEHPERGERSLRGAGWESTQRFGTPPIFTGGC